MGGHGGLNILPQKRWNVYNYDNREKVRRDEEAAAKEEQLKREQTRKRDAEFRLEQLRTARGLAPLKRSAEESEPKTGHINLFEGIKIFDPIQGGSEEKKGGDDRDDSKKKKKKKKEEGRAKVVVTAEEEKYRLGYGVAGKGVKLPWYLERRREDVNTEKGGGEAAGRVAGEDGKRGGKKTVEELREERLRRERREKERERALLMENNTTHGASAFSDRNPCRSRR